MVEAALTKPGSEEFTPREILKPVVVYDSPKTNINLVVSQVSAGTAETTARAETTRVWKREAMVAFQRCNARARERLDGFVSSKAAR